MAIRIINLAKTSLWAWDKDPDYGTEDETKFEFRPLDSYEQAHLNDRLTTMEGMPSGTTEEEVEASINSQGIRTEVFKVAIEAFRIATVGFTNLQDEEGNPVEFVTEKANIGGKAKKVLAGSILKSIPPLLAMAAYKHIMEMNTVSKAAEKKSGKA